MGKKVNIGENVVLGDGSPLVLIAGPCGIEDEEKGEKITYRIARKINRITEKLEIPFIFKSSFDKANRTSIASFRGPNLEVGLEILREIKEGLSIPVISDIHLPEQARKASEVLDIIQIPAFLCRQTDLLLAAGKTGKPVNIKKGQFMAPQDMSHAIKKIEHTGNKSILLTERGTCFGYHNYVVDMRSLPIMKKFGYPVVFDATHSVQLPGGEGDRSGGEREFVPYLSRAAVAIGVDALFLEVHENPSEALSDGPNMLGIRDLEDLLKTIKQIDIFIKGLK